MQHLEILAKKKRTNNDEQAEETAPTPEQTDQPVEETNIQDEDPPVQQLKSIELSDLARMLKEKIENHIKENRKKKTTYHSRNIQNHVNDMDILDIISDGNPLCVNCCEVVYNKTSKIIENQKEHEQSSSKKPVYLRNKGIYSDIFSPLLTNIHALTGFQEDFRNPLMKQIPVIFQQQKCEIAGSE
ncbi:Tubulin-specific chaperone A, partial [Ophiophagus hannah]